MATTSDEREGAYRGVPGMDEGFIHLSAANQVRKTAALYFQGVEDLLLLKFDKERLDQSGISLRYEEAAPPAGTQLVVLTNNAYSAKVKRLGREDFLASGGDLARWVARALGDGRRRG